MFDANCHLQFDALWDDHAQIWQRAVDAGVSQAVVSSDVLTAQRLVRLERLAAEGRVITAGWHPLFPRARAALKILANCFAAHPDWGLGEVGIDTRHQPMADQAEFLSDQMDLAQGRFCVLHAVGPSSLDAALSVAKQHSIRGAVHAFNGSWQQAQQWLDLGWYLSIGGPVVNPAATRLAEWVEKVPEDRLLIESDAPDLPPHGWQGHNEPASLALVAKRVAQIRGVGVDAIAQSTARNTSQWILGSA